MPTEEPTSPATSAPTDNQVGVEGKEEDKHLPEPQEMRAVVLTAFGGVNRVKVMKRVVPTPEEGEVLIRVKSCGLNFVDVMVRQGAIDNPPRTPLVMGYECSGLVEAVGEGVPDFEIGDRVIAFKRYGTFCEVIATPSKYCYKMPEDMSFDDGAALGISYTTAYMLIFDVANIKPGKSVLVHSAGGGVGLAISQLCHMMDGVKLFGTASTNKHEAIKDKFDHLVDTATQDYVEAIKKINPEGVDVVLDCLCGDDTNKGYNLLRPMGKYVLYGSSNVVSGETRSFFNFARAWWQIDKVNPTRLFDDNRSVCGFHLLALLFDQGRAELVSEVMHDLLKLYCQGKIHPVVDSTWAFEEVGDAMMKMHDRTNVGKLIIKPEQVAKPKPEPTSGECNADLNSTEEGTSAADDGGSPKSD